MQIRVVYSSKFTDTYKQRIGALHLNTSELCSPLPQLPWLRAGTKCATAHGRVWNAMFASVCRRPTSNLPLTPSPTGTVMDIAMATNHFLYFLPHRRAVAEWRDQIWASYDPEKYCCGWQMGLRNDQLSQYQQESDTEREITLSCAGLMLRSSQSWMYDNPDDSNLSGFWILMILASGLVAFCFLVLGRWCIKKQCYHLFL